MFVIVEVSTVAWPLKAESEPRLPLHRLVHKRRPPDWGRAAAQVHGSHHRAQFIAGKCGLLLRNLIEVTIIWIYRKTSWFLNCGNLN